MATAKKTPAKKTTKTPLQKKAKSSGVAIKKSAPKQQASLLVSKRTIAKVPASDKFIMPREVADWIERANSTINHLRGQIEELKRENKELKAYRKFAEGRILNVSAE